MEFLWIEEMNYPCRENRIPNFEQILIYLNKCSLVRGVYQFITSQGSGYTFTFFIHGLYGSWYGLTWVPPRIHMLKP